MNHAALPVVLNVCRGMNMHCVHDGVCACMMRLQQGLVRKHLGRKRGSTRRTGTSGFIRWAYRAAVVVMWINVCGAPGDKQRRQVPVAPSVGPLASLAVWAGPTLRVRRGVGHLRRHPMGPLR